MFPVHGKRYLRLQALLIELHVNNSLVFRLEYLPAYGNSNNVVTWLHRDLADLQAERIVGLHVLGGANKEREGRRRRSMRS